MDITSICLIGLLLTFFLSWAIYKYLLKGSVWQDKYSDYVGSLSGFLKYLFFVCVIFLIIIYCDTPFISNLLDNSLNIRHHGTTDGTSSDIKTIFFSFATVWLGAILFQYGFSRMSEYQLERNIPRSKIRSAALGLVEVQGVVASEKLLTTPYSKSACVYYRSELQEYRRHYNSETGSEYRWETISSDTHRLPFWVKDETGQLGVDSTYAEFEIPDKQFGYLGSENECITDPPLSTSLGDKRFTESFLAPNDTVCVLGTLAVRKNNSNAFKVIQRGSNNSTFIIAHSSKRELNSALKWQMLSGLVYGSLLFIAGIYKILQLAELL